MSEQTKSTGWLYASGSPYTIGRALGEAGRAAVHEKLLPSDIWSTITAAKHQEAVARMAATTQSVFPQVWAELEGLAAGLALPLMDVFAWNCRGDLLAGEAPDGCTTLQVPGVRPIVAHNEDGLPFFYGHCFMVEAAPENQPDFLAFCYPGSLPGHTAACTSAGLVQTVNNIRLTGLVPQVPRMVLGRAVLAQRSVDEALDVLCSYARSGGFHFTLAQAGSDDILSVEFGGGEVSSQRVTAPSVHSNHALHHSLGLVQQKITESSRDRQYRGVELLANGIQEPLAFLHDTGGEGLPILRLSRLYDCPGAKPVYAGYVTCETAP
mgnify:CR=1 FL=1